MAANTRGEIIVEGDLKFGCMTNMICTSHFQNYCDLCIMP